MKYLFVLLIAFLTVFTPFHSWAQKPLVLKAYSFPKVMPERYLFDPKSDYTNMLEMPKPKGFTQNQYKRYAEEMCYAKSDAFYSGDMYVGWTELEAYLNTMIGRLAGKKFKDKPLKAYPKRSAEINAFCIHDGSFYINVGLIANAKNEAALAVVLGHEMSHYLKNHLSSSYLAMTKANTKLKRNRNFSLIANNLYTDRQRELQADSMGAVLAAKAGYDLKQGTSNFYLMLEEEMRYKNKQDANDTEGIVEEEDKTEAGKDSKGDRILSTHPDMKRRIRIFKKTIRLHNPDSAKIFQIGEAAFKDLQNKAKLEVLAILKEQNDYRACAEKAFTFYLFEPSNDVYVYYALESIRRVLFLEKSMAKKPFLTDDYKENSYNNIANGILGNLQILITDTSRFKDILARELIVPDSATKYPFVTWSGAFKYFSKIAEKRKIPECYLTLALFNNKNSEKRNDYLKKYIDAGNYPYKEYAQYLMKDQLNVALKENTKELVMSSDIRFLEDHFYGYHYSRIYSEATSPKYELELNKMLAKSFPNKVLVNYHDLVKENLAKAVRYKQIMLASMLIKDKSNEEDAVDEDASEDAPKSNSKVDTAGKKSPIRKNKQKSVTDEDFFPKDNLPNGDQDNEWLKFGKKNKKSRVTNSENTDIFILNPDIWKLFKSEQLKALEVVRVTAFKDQTKVLGTHMGKALIICFPLLPELMWYELWMRISAGSPRYLYTVNYYRFSPSNSNNINWFVNETVHYKLNKSNLDATTYNIFKSSDNEFK